MYLKEVVLINSGPIGFIAKKFAFSPEGNPKPLIIIGQNGSGKSVFISHIVNALITAKQIVYEDREIEEGKVFKYRSPSYIKLGEPFSYSSVNFEQDIFQTEIQLDRSKTEFENHYQFTPSFRLWNNLQGHDSSVLDSNFSRKILETRNLIDENTLLYFPPNRFEEPGWLNYSNLINKADYRFVRRLSNLSNRIIINHSPLKDNQNWLLDIVFDRAALELKTTDLTIPLNQGGQQITLPVKIFAGFQGESNNIYNEIISFLKTLFQTEGNLRFGIGKRRSRQVQILKDEKVMIPNLFNLSTGETVLLNIFLTIIKDYDLSNAEFENLSQIRGIVIIDEVDVHLHANLQHTVLPKLLKLFPKVQFILTSHSPLFLLGLHKELGEQNFEIMSLPDGNEIDVESFSEFEKAYEYFKDSVKFQNDVKEEISKSNKPLLFVEGDYDIKYLKRAAELFNRDNLLNEFKVVDSEGHGNISNVAKHFDSKLADVTPQKILLLYDCDVNKPSSNRGKVFKRTMPTNNRNPIQKGIENLFPETIINNAMAHKSAFIDVTPEFIKLQRGEEVKIPRVLEINKNEKKNLCEWIIANSTREDFIHFESVFDIFEEVLNYR